MKAKEMTNELKPLSCNEDKINALFKQFKIEIEEKIKQRSYDNKTKINKNVLFAINRETHEWLDSIKNKGNPWINNLNRNQFSVWNVLQISNIGIEVINQKRHE